jgi:predicted glycoside hydrolase/deacetylase ChbG (UPF0249 family)
MKTKRLIFCADDWGFSPGINDGILELARRGLLHSVSCVANSNYLETGLSELLEYQKLGLNFNIHFNLTYQRPVNLLNHTLVNANNGNTFYTFPSLFFKTILMKVSPSEVLNEFEAQMKVLRDLNIPITGLDGHHHVHLIPFIYKSLSANLVKNGVEMIRYMNDFEHKMTYFQSLYFKQFLHKMEGAIKLLPCGYALPHNLVNKKEIEKKILRHARLIVHPAKYNDFKKFKMTDPLQEERVSELNALLRFLNE